MRRWDFTLGLVAGFLLLALLRATLRYGQYLGRRQGVIVFPGGGVAAAAQSDDASDTPAA